MANRKLEDWHWADVAAAIYKTGTNMSTLSRENGYDKTAVRKALRQPWPAVERIIAKHLGIPPREIWPSRYKPDGTPKSEGPSRVNNSKDPRLGNIQSRKVA